MCFATRRALPLALSMAAFTVGLGLSSQAHAQWPFNCTIPRLVPAYNFTTGGEFRAPPVPYGHYAKDYVGDVQKCLACIHGQFCPLHSGLGHGLGHGHGDGDGNDGYADPGTASSGAGAGYFSSGGSHCGVPGCFGGLNCGILGHHKKCSPADGTCGAPGYATTTGGPSPQAAPIASGQAACGHSGCTVNGKHSHVFDFSGHSGSGLCGDPACGIGHPHSHGQAFDDPQSGCPYCGGKGCSHCLGKQGGLGSKLHGKLASLTGMLYPTPRVKWFVGAGGPVPLTPGYVPYIVATRSPRDFFAFPPMNPNDP
jgi:hypothetical protein